MTPQLEFSDSRYQQKKVAKLEYPHPTPRFLYIVMEKCEAVSADNKKIIKARQNQILIPIWEELVELSL